MTRIAARLRAVRLDPANRCLFATWAIWKATRGKW